MYDDFSKFSSSIIFISMDEKPPVSYRVPHFFPMNSLSAISSLLNVFQYLHDLLFSGSVCVSHFFMFYSYVILIPFSLSFFCPLFLCGQDVVVISAVA